MDLIRDTGLHRGRGVLHYLTNSPSGSYGTFTLAANEMLDLYEVDLPAGHFQIRLENLTSTADLGLSVYPPEVGVISRIDTVPNGAAWLEVAGADEQVTVEIPSPGLYCIAVWKPKVEALPLIAFDLPKPGPVTLDVFDLQGSRVRRLMGEHEDAGRHEVPWDGKDETGRPVASGIYLVRLEADGANRVARIALTR